MESKDVLSIDLDALDAMDTKERINAIDDALHRLNFERRVTLLTDTQRKHMSEAPSLQQLKAMNECKTDKERDALINDMARATYIKRCAWADYLNGVTPNAPVPAESTEVVKCE